VWLEDKWREEGSQENKAICKKMRLQGGTGRGEKIGLIDTVEWVKKVEFDQTMVVDVRRKGYGRSNARLRDT
jgi:hypothetical protein